MLTLKIDYVNWLKNKCVKYLESSKFILSSIEASWLQSPPNYHAFQQKLTWNEKQVVKFRGYSLETEWNDTKLRCAMYIKNNIPQHRRRDLEQANMHVMIIDINLKQKFRLINMYRAFSPPNNQSQMDYFTTQIDII